MRDGGFATVNEDLRLQQVYATLINFGGAELADRIRVGGLTRRMQHWIYKVPGPVPALSSAVKTRVMPESLGPPTSSWGRSSPARPVPCPMTGGSSWTGCRTRCRRCRTRRRGR